MPDTTTTDPGDPPLIPSPMLVPAAIPVLQKFTVDLRALCSAVSLAGATPDMILGALWGVGWMILDGCKDATLAPTNAPVSGPVAGPSTDPVMAPLLTLVNGVSTTTVALGAVLTLGAVALPTADGPVLTLGLDPSNVPLTGLAAYSLELGYTASTGLTYTAGGLWPGVTLYGKPGDLLKLTVSATNVVSANISQDGGVTWVAFYTYPTPATAAPMMYVHVTQTPCATAASVVPAGG